MFPHSVHGRAGYGSATPFRWTPGYATRPVRNDMYELAQFTLNPHNLIICQMAWVPPPLWRALRSRSSHRGEGGPSHLTFLIPIVHDYAYAVSP